MKILKLVLIIFMLEVVLFSCKKEDNSNGNTETIDSNTNSFSDFSKGESNSNELSKISEELVDYSTEDYSNTRFNTNITRRWIINSCAIVTVSPAYPDLTFPKTITIDFGAGCLSTDGKTRSGKIIVVATGKLRDSSSSYTTTLNNYVVDGKLIVGTKTVINQGLNSANHLVYNIISNITVTKTSGIVITYNNVRTREWVAGISTTLFSHGLIGLQDNIFWITGSASGSSSAGRTFVTNITEKLILKGDCNYITSGKINHIPTGRTTRKIDWGNGTCDNQVSVEINGVIYYVTL